MSYGYPYDSFGKGIGKSSNNTSPFAQVSSVMEVSKANYSSGGWYDCGVASIDKTINANRMKRDKQRSDLKF